MSRSGGMTTEISSTLTAAGLGVSTAISIGGDAIIGSTYAELMPLFEADEQTEAIVIYTEPGGRMEAQLAEWVAENDSRLPIVAFMAGPLHGRRGDEGHVASATPARSWRARRTPRPRRSPASRRPASRSWSGSTRSPTRSSEKLREGRRLMPGLFIDVEVADEVARRRRAGQEARGGLPGRHLRRDRQGGVEILEEQLDECVLCELCLDAAPDGHGRVIKLYDGDRP